MSEGEVSLIGTLERVVFSNPENGFLIGTFLEEKHGFSNNHQGRRFRSSGPAEASPEGKLGKSPPIRKTIRGPGVHDC